MVLFLSTLQPGDAKHTTIHMMNIYIPTHPLDEAVDFGIKVSDHG